MEVPVSLSNLNPSHQFGVFEVGMSKEGEINQLSKMIRPNLAIITNIAEAHIENFSNIKGIAKAKSNTESLRADFDQNINSIKIEAELSLEKLNNIPKNSKEEISSCDIKLEFILPKKLSL